MVGTRIFRSGAVVALLSLFGANLALADARVTLKVVDAVTGAAIPNYKFIVNVDNTGTTTQRSPDPGTGCNPQDAGYPNSCTWTSIAGAKGHSPVYTQGDNTNMADKLGAMLIAGQPNLVPNGRYLVSVLADGHRLDGRHFTVSGSNVTWQGKLLADPAGEVKVQMQPWPLPKSQIQAAVFEDISPVNSAPDLPAEHGLAGFQGHILDVLGEVTTDVDGGPLCGSGRCLSKCYVVNNGKDIGIVTPLGWGNNPIAPPVSGPLFGRCPVITEDANGNIATFPMFTEAGVANGTTPTTAVIEGKVKIPNLGPNRYTLSVTPTDGSGFVQTTTLEGNHDWDSWVMEGSTGLDTEFLIGGEPFPAIIFGYTPSPGTQSANSVGSSLSAASLGGSGSITGVVERVKIYVPTTGGVGGLPGQIWGGLQGAVLDKPEDQAWITLTDLGNGDTIRWAGQGDAEGKFTIPNVPAGTYTLTWWDEPQNQILDLVNVTVGTGENVDMGILPLSGWWTVFDGYVFNDANRNGIFDKDAGEVGLSGYTLTMRRRDNTLMDRGTTIATSEADGYYKFEAAYPMTQWLVMEAYDDLHYTTGVTYQADNQPTPTTLLGAGVDVSVHPIIGLSGRMDWGKHVYDATGRASGGLDPRNGGIVGTVSYDTTRNELDPRYAAVEDWQPSISDLTVNLYTALYCGASENDIVLPCDPSGTYAVRADGSHAKGPKINTYLSETWHRPKGCVARGADGTPLVHGVDEDVLPLDDDLECIEAPLMGVQFWGGNDPGTTELPGVEVDGNYGFGDGCFVSPTQPGAINPETGECAAGTFQPLPAGDYLVEVDLSSQLDSTGEPVYKVTREEDINIGNGDEFAPAVPPPACAGALHVVDSSGNPNFPGTPPYEGQNRPLCDVKLVSLSNGKSIAPAFNIFTDVPLPGRHWFIIIDDLNFSSNPQSTTFGEKAGMPFVPVGVYDYTDRLITTVESDYNGLADVLLPSTNRINCPTPSGVCSGMYRYVGNDPGVPGRLNLNFNPSFRTIAAEFEVTPGVIIPADLAPTQVGVTVQVPGGLPTNAVQCRLDDVTPELYAVDDPVVDFTTGSATSRAVTVSGKGFGLAAGARVLLDGVQLATSGWTNTSFVATVPRANFGPHQLRIIAANGHATVNGLTLHVLGSTSSLAAFPSTTFTDNFNSNNGSGTSNLTDRNGWDTTTPVNSYLVSNLAGNNNDNVFVLTGAAISYAWVTSGNAPGTNQDAYFTFRQLASNTNSTKQQGLLLKYSGGNNPGSTSARWIAVVATSTNIQVLTKNGTATITPQGTIAGTFAANDQIGARADANGVVTVYKNGTAIGSASLAFTASWTGRIGMLFQNAGTSAADRAIIDDFGGGTVATISSGYTPNVYRVGPGRTYAPSADIAVAADHAIQRGLDAATTYVEGGSNRTALVVVYPNNPTVTNPRLNPRGAYYENLIMTGRVKLQGVGPGAPDGSVRGSIIDGSGFSGDSPVAADWYTRIAQETTLDANNNAIPNWAGNGTIYDGAVISLYLPSSGNGAFPTTYSANTAPSIDGFDLRGGDQQGFPGNINMIGGLPTGLPGGLITQGGAIFANAYANNLQITNNVVQNNGGAYGTVRIGTPDLSGDDNENNNVVIAFNRVIANGGTNQAGGIGLFGGADNYQVANNDICGNFSAEYGGGLSVVGRSPNGKINDNRIYLNRSYDEGGGIMIAGALPTNTAVLSPGTGRVDIFNNLVQANLSNDDGGGIRFLMSGGRTAMASGEQMNVYNNIVVDNVSTHEGGGISINDAPNVRVFNNTIMKNLTTATAITSSGAPAPAGLSTSMNSNLLQATLPSGSPLYSNPLLFNNIFWDNRAGTRALTSVTGLSDADADHWDLGVSDGAGQLSPTNSVIQQGSGAHGGYVVAASNQTPAAGPQVVSTYDVGVTFNSWRNNPAFLGAILIAADLPPTLMGDYHLAAGSPAIDAGASSKSGTNAPGVDYDNQARPAGAGIDIGADEVSSSTGGGGGGPSADLGVVINSPLGFGQFVRYSIVVTNAGPATVNAANVLSAMPRGATSMTWACTPRANCPSRNGIGAINANLNLAMGQSATFTVTTRVPLVVGPVSVTATVSAAGVTDSNPGNNSATRSVR